jgi:hypothetical protein
MPGTMVLHEYLPSHYLEIYLFIYPLLLSIYLSSRTEDLWNTDKNKSGTAKEGDMTILLFYLR